ncbi:hypothetical protein BC834DRAFT_948639 [Gloeopeniophorella convolvens]|nr:hypothetical protein BC834DRAFT_948639 [Gloeopeniophorella convolvens]
MKLKLHAATLAGFLAAARAQGGYAEHYGGYGGAYGGPGDRYDLEGPRAALAAKRAPASSSASSTSASIPNTSTDIPTTAAAVAGATSTSTGGAAQHSSSASSATPAAHSTPPPAAAPPPPAGPNGVPPLTAISAGMPPGVPLPPAATYAPGSAPPLAGAPPLPAAFRFDAAKWPAQDKVPPTDSPEVKGWLRELDGFDVPGLAPTKDGSCAGDPGAAGDARARGWWTCGGFTRATDITACPRQFDWGVSFDDGPSEWSEQLLNYMDKQDIKATFFVVGSRVIERPPVLIEEYMSGHEISVHTWSHRPLTSLTNEQIVAELGWTRKAIQAVIGVTPTTMRPPYGDIDDRVRAISLAMGMIPIIWTSAPGSGPFDTNDWRVAGGLVDATTSFNTFEGILGNASTLSTGFIVLQHDLFEVTVDLATGYTLNAALTHNPTFSLKPIGKCMGIPATNMYAETNKNASFPYTNHPVVTSSNSTTETVKDGKSQADMSSGAERGFVFSWAIAGLLELDVQRCFCERWGCVH